MAGVVVVLGIRPYTNYISYHLRIRRVEINGPVMYASAGNLVIDSAIGMEVQQSKKLSNALLKGYQCSVNQWTNLAPVLLNMVGAFEFLRRPYR